MINPAQITNYEVAQKWSNIHIPTTAMDEIFEIIENTCLNEMKKAQSPFVDSILSPKIPYSKNTIEFDVDLSESLEFYQIVKDILPNPFGRKLVSTTFLLNRRDTNPYVVQILENGDNQNKYFMHITKFLKMKNIRYLNFRIFEVPTSYTYHIGPHSEYESLNLYVDTLNNIFGFNLTTGIGYNKDVVILNDIATKARKIITFIMKNKITSINYDDPEVQMLFLRGVYLKGLMNAYNEYKVQLGKNAPVTPFVEVLPHNVKMFESLDEYKKHGESKLPDPRQMYDDHMHIILGRLDTSHLSKPGEYRKTKNHYCAAFDIDPSDIMSKLFTDDAYNIMNKFIRKLKVESNLYVRNIFTKVFTDMKNNIGITNPGLLAIHDANMGNLKIKIPAEVATIFKRTGMDKNYKLYINNLFRHMVYFYVPLMRVIGPYYDLVIDLNQLFLEFKLKDVDLVDYIWLPTSKPLFGAGWNISYDRFIQHIMYLLINNSYLDLLSNKVNLADYLISKEVVSFNVSNIGIYYDETECIHSIFVNMAFNPELCKTAFDSTYGEFNVSKVVEANKFHQHTELIDIINDITVSNIFAMDHRDLISALKEQNKGLFMSLNISNTGDIILTFKIRPLQYAVAG